jgi:hypothetical protein
MCLGSREASSPDDATCLVGGSVLHGHACLDPLDFRFLVDLS